jgi:catechol 2,3-dioxygenase-like lactoylglutathione lyase family enzyme
MKKTITLLKKNKITITDEPYQLSSGGSYIAFIEDPDGILIELIERK